MDTTEPADTLPAAERPSQSVEALDLYESVEVGTNSALRPARVPS